MVELANNLQQSRIYFVYDSHNHSHKIEIPIANNDELVRYKNAILNVLTHVIIDDCDESMQDDLKTIYALLLHFEVNKQKHWNPYYQDFLVRHEEDYFL